MGEISKFTASVAVIGSILGVFLILFWPQIIRLIDLVINYKKRNPFYDFDDEDRVFTNRNDKARALFYSRLSAEQKITAKRGYILVQGNISGDIYCISLMYGTSNNIQKLRFGIGINSYCIISAVSDIPNYDTFLAQKIMIECNEEKFLREAVLSM